MNSRILIFFTVMLAFLLNPAKLWAQNLLMNSGFEDENICTEYIKNCAPEGWISNSLSANYYFDDVRNAEEGQHFAGLRYSSRITAFGPHFLRSRLLCRLRKGSRYIIELYVRSTHNDIDSIGIFFSDKDMLYQKNGLKQASTPLMISDGIVEQETKPGRWQKVQLFYSATGNENFIAIADAKKMPRRVHGIPDVLNDFYYFIDDIHLSPVNAREKLCDDAAQVKAREYDMNDRHTLLEKRIYQLSKKPGPVEVVTTQTSLQRVDTLVIPDVLFETNIYDLSYRAKRVLDSFVRAGSKVILSIDSLVVEGHTDSVGSVNYNERLSMRRAQSVAQYLQPFYPKDIQIRGWGRERPIADNTTPEGRRLNRRVEIYLYIRE